jgi:delta-aminolevulinic acid dehydratase/porphobilinogen synthase
LRRRLLQIEGFDPPNGAPKYGAPASAYQVSGEYPMIMAAASNGWLDGDRARGAEQRVAQKTCDAISA